MNRDTGWPKFGFNVRRMLTSSSENLQHKKKALLRRFGIDSTL